MKGPSRVLVVGRDRDPIPELYAQEGVKLGRFIAGSGCDLICGPTGGIGVPVMEGFWSLSEHGRVIHVSTGSGTDIIENVASAGVIWNICTPFDFPMRNVFQVSLANAVMVLTGGDATLQEALVALCDYHIPVGVVRESGTAALAIVRLSELYPEWKPRLIVGNEAEDVVSRLLSHVTLTGG